MSRPRILISGAGPAGLVLAYWLGKHEFSVLLVERALSQGQNSQGQVIDIEGPAQEVIARMGLLDNIKAEGTHEAGVTFVDKAGRTYGTLHAGQTALSSEIEVQRPVLTRVLLEAVSQHENVQVKWGTAIQSLEQTEKGVRVELLSRADDLIQKEIFDIVVAADGLRSRTRDLILDSNERDNAVRSVGAYTAFFSIPAEERDRPIWRIMSIPGKKQFSIKPLSETESSCYALIGKQDSRLKQARESRDTKKQKEIVAELFRGQGWETDRAMRDMMDSKNFYFEEISQVMLDKWWKGRCVLVGDAAYCPSPITGQGTNLAIVGAYVLAARLVGCPEDHEKAFEQYDKELRPYVNKAQPIPLGGKAYFWTLPQTSLACWMLRVMTWGLLSAKVHKLFPDIGRPAFHGLPDLR